jgi:carbon-monoxide dehydrogenase large subunit
MTASGQPSSAAHAAPRDWHGLQARWLGSAVKRKEDPRLLTGKGRFLDDIRLSGMLHAAFVRSPRPPPPARCRAWPAS